MTFRHLLLPVAILALTGAASAHAEGDAPEPHADIHRQALSDRVRAKRMAKAAQATKAAQAARAANAATAPSGLPMIPPAPTLQPAALPIAYDDLPPAARAGLLTYYRSVSTDNGACPGLSFGQFVLGLAPILKTEYNRDGEPDFLFSAPCAGLVGSRASAARDALGPPQKILLSDPFGYHVSVTFAASLGRVRDRTVLVSAVDCPSDAAAADAASGRCYAGRVWDPVKAVWGDVQPIGGPGPPLKVAGSTY